MKVFGWLADHSGCGWYRVLMPCAALRQQGVETAWSNRLIEEGWEADLIICQRTCLPGPSDLLERMAKHKGKRPMLVYELDDDLWNIDRHNQARHYYSDPEIRANLVRNIKTCDAVTVSTEPLADIVRKWNPNVHVLPNMIPGEWLDWRRGQHTDRVTIGWQGSPTHDGDWAPIKSTIQTWFGVTKRNRITRGQLPIEMHTIGEVPAHFPEVYPHRQSSWSESIDDYYRKVDWHIALAPLASTTFNESKSDIRVLEAAMLGIPVVASRAASAYSRFVRDNETGFLAGNAMEWRLSLNRLLDDPDMAREMGENARTLAATRRIEDNAQMWLDAWAS